MMFMSFSYNYVYNALPPKLFSKTTFFAPNIIFFAEKCFSFIFFTIFAR